MSLFMLYWIYVGQPRGYSSSRLERKLIDVKEIWLPLKVFYAIFLKLAIRCSDGAFLNTSLDFSTYECYLAPRKIRTKEVRMNTRPASFVGWLYMRYNPIIVLCIRPTLKLVNAHNHPIRGGIAAAIVSGIAHYGIVFPLFWHQDVVLTLSAIPWGVHLLIGINSAGNFLIGLIRYYTGEYGNRIKRLDY